MMADYPNAPGFYPHAPETSQEAAVSVADAAKSREAKALALIASSGPLGRTADEVANALGWERYSSRPRLSTLKKQGKLASSDLRRKGSSGRRQSVYVLPEYGPPPADDGQANLPGIAA